MTFGSLFSGIGGLDLGLEWAGMQCLWQYEIDPFCRKVLAKHWPGIVRHGDITKVDWQEAGRPDLICGGFPCQDISEAGKKAGITGARSGLWVEYKKCISILRPRFVLVENVAAILVRGMDAVLRDLAEVGYDAEWDCVPASLFGAPHNRNRVFIVAYPSKERWGDGCVIKRPYAIHRNEKWNATKNIKHWSEWKRWLSSLVQDGNDIGASSGLLGVDDGIPNRMDRIGGLGNAVLPVLAEWYGRQIISNPLTPKGTP